MIEVYQLQNLYCPKIPTVRFLDESSFYDEENDDHEQFESNLMNHETLFRTWTDQLDRDDLRELQLGNVSFENLSLPLPAIYLRITIS